MQIIPIKPVDHQKVYWTLRPADIPYTDFVTKKFGQGQWQNANAGGNVQVDIRKRSTGLFADVYFNEKLIVAGAICFDRVPLIRSAYLNFPGDLAFVDQHGTSDPTADGLGARYQLCYLALGERPFDPVVTGY